MHLPLQNTQLIIIACVFLSATIIVVGLRLLSRRLKHFHLRANDYLIIAALCFYTAQCGVMIDAKLNVPEGVHDGDLPQSDVARERKTYLASSIVWVSTMATLKLSILHLYMTLFTDRMFVRSVYLVMALNLAWWISMVIAEVTICQPLAYSWDKSINGHCDDISSLYMAEAIINVIFDAVVVALPMPQVWKLNLQLLRKVILSGIFGLGAIVIVIIILRIVALSMLDSNDLQYRSFYFDMFTSLEPSIAIINACLPVMQPVIVKIRSFNIIPKYLETMMLRISGPSNCDTSNTVGSSQEPSHLSQPTGHADTRNFNRVYDNMYPLPSSNMSAMSSATTLNEERRDSSDKARPVNDRSEHLIQSQI